MNGSKSWSKAEAAGLRVLSTADAAKAASVSMILVADHIQGDLYHTHIEPHMSAGKTLMFAHGFNIHFDQIKPGRRGRRVDDRAQGSGPSRARSCSRKASVFRAGRGSPGRVGKALPQALAYARALGCLKAGRDRNDIQRGNRKRSLWRTSGIVWRRQ
jgi:ketol-acid reductoisomerase